jgi:hypothetical protein
MAKLEPGEGTTVTHSAIVVVAGRSAEGFPVLREVLMENGVVKEVIAEKAVRDNLGSVPPDTREVLSRWQHWRRK